MKQSHCCRLITQRCGESGAGKQDIARVGDGRYIRSYEPPSASAMRGTAVVRHQDTHCTEEVVMRVNITGPVLIAALATIACQDSPTAPRELSAPPTAAADRSEGKGSAETAENDEANKPNFNLNIVLRGDGSGRVKFRQPKNDGTTHMVNLGARGLSQTPPDLSPPAGDITPDGICTSTGCGCRQGSVPPPIPHTKQKGGGALPSFFVSVGRPMSGVSGRGLKGLDF